MRIPYEVTCRTEGCPNEGKVWTVNKQDMAVSSNLKGLLKLPNLICEGCDIHPEYVQGGAYPFDVETPREKSLAEQAREADMTFPGLEDLDDD